VVAQTIVFVVCVCLMAGYMKQNSNSDEQVPELLLVNYR
jgi:hypothetical protein